MSSYPLGEGQEKEGTSTMRPNNNNSSTSSYDQHDEALVLSQEEYVHQEYYQEQQSDEYNDYPAEQDDSGQYLRSFANGGGEQQQQHQQYQSSATSSNASSSGAHYPTSHNLIRTNFGKYRGYDPPATPTSPNAAAFNYHHHGIISHSSKIPGATTRNPIVTPPNGEEEEVPFDQQQYHYPPNEPAGQHRSSSQQYYEDEQQQDYVDQRYDEQYQHHHHSRNEHRRHQHHDQHQQQLYRDVNTPSPPQEHDHSQLGSRRAGAVVTSLSPRPFDEQSQQPQPRSSPDRSFTSSTLRPSPGRRPAAGILDMAPQQPSQEDYLPMLSSAALQTHNHSYNSGSPDGVVRSDPGVASTTNSAVVTPPRGSSAAGVPRHDMYQYEQQQQRGYYPNEVVDEDDHYYGSDSALLNGNHFRMAPLRVSDPRLDADFFELTTATSTTNSAAAVYDEYGSPIHQYDGHDDPYNEDDARRRVTTPSPTSDSLFVHHPTSPNALASPGAATSPISNSAMQQQHLQLQQPSLSHLQQQQYYDRRSVLLDQSYEEFGIANGSSISPPPVTYPRKSALKNPNLETTTEEDDSLFDFEEQRRKQELKSRKKHQRSRMRRMREETDDETSDDAYGTPNSTSRSSSSRLATRAQAAWKRKSARERASRHKFGGNTTTSGSSNTNSAAHVGVSFGEKNNTIHRYEAEADTTTIGDASTLTGRSLNSEYTKSLESEVEDAIKDIFMFGSARKNNPGRRKVKYRPGMSRMLRTDENDEDDEEQEEVDDETLETETLETETLETATLETATLGTAESSIPVRKVRKSGAAVDDPQSSNSGSGRAAGGASGESSTSSRQGQKHKGKHKQKHKHRDSEELDDEKKEEEDPLMEAWNLFETGLSAVSAALGIEKEDGEKDERRRRHRHHRSMSSERRGGRESDSVEEKTEPQRKSKRNSQRQSRRDSTSTQGESISSANRQDKMPRENVIDYACKVVNQTNATDIGCGRLGMGMGGRDAVDNDDEGSNNNPDDEEDDKEDDEDDNIAGGGGGLKSLSFLKPAPSLEEDLRLIELAVQAARSFHKLHGYLYDDTHEIDIVSDIKFVVVDLYLPLGLIFQENECGCWITKVMPAGSAAKKGAVAVGDQLAAIDGISAIHLKVDQVAAAVRSKNEEFELTFLRYVGPLRAAAAVEADNQGGDISTNDKSADINCQSKPAASPVAAATSSSDTPEKVSRLVEDSRSGGRGPGPTQPTPPKKETCTRKKGKCLLGTGNDRSTDSEHDDVAHTTTEDHSNKSDKSQPQQQQQQQQQQHRQQQQQPTEEKKRFRLFGRMRRSIE